MRRPAVIALDGPAGAGKSTVGEQVARHLGYFYFDTGALYRAVAVRVIEQGVDPLDEAALERLVATLDVVVRPASTADGRQYDVVLHGRDVSGATRSPEVDRLVSTVAASPAVRRGLIEPQRRQVQGLGTVMAGRDIGTVVCPEADLKVYLDASASERARRRSQQVGAGPDQLALIQASIEERDRLDSSRALAPLAQAPDAHRIDTDELPIDRVVKRVLSLAASKGLPSRRPE